MWKTTAAAWALFAFSLTSASAGTLDDIAEYAGSAQCEAGPLYVRVTSEPGGARIEYASAPGQMPWAIGHSYVPNNIRFTEGKPTIGVGVEVGSWAYRPIDMDARLGEHQHLAMVADDTTDGFTLSGLASCGPVKLARLAVADSIGGTTSLHNLPRRWSGTVGCYPLQKGLRPSDEMGLSLTIVPISDREFEGRVSLSARQDPDAEIVHSVIGEFDPDTGGLIVVGDSWISKSRFVNEVVTFEGRILGGGARIAGTTSAQSCGSVLLEAISDVPSPKMRPRAPASVSPTYWDTPAACVTMIDWASQAEEETGGQPLSQLIGAQVAKISPGLFADERFAPFFGKPFSDLSPEERQSVVKLKEACRFQYDHAQAMQTSMGYQLVDLYFPEKASQRWIDLKRYALLRRKLTREMEVLDARSVSAADVDELTTLQGALPVQYADIWTADINRAQMLVSAKLEVAYGKLAERLSGKIDELPAGLEAFRDAEVIERDMLVMSGEGDDDRAALAEKLDKKLVAAADDALGKFAKELADRTPDLAALSILQQRSNTVSLVFGSRIPSGEGYKAFRSEAERIAEGAYASFEAQVEQMIDESLGFEDREAQYGSLLRFVSRSVPASSLISDRFAAYNALIKRLEPTPRESDLVLADGQPTDYGLRLAVANYVSTTWAESYAILPFDITALVGTVRLSRVDKLNCASAEAGGYWCDIQVSLDGSMPIARQFSELPAQVRVEFVGSRWRVVELPPSSGRVASAYLEVEQQRQENQAFWNDFYYKADIGLTMKP